MISLKTPYNPTKDPRFVSYKGVKTYYMMKSREAGKGRLAGQAGSFSTAVIFLFFYVLFLFNLDVLQEMNYLLQHDCCTVWSPSGLQRILFAHLVTTFNYRVDAEIRRITLGTYFCNESNVNQF
jgi:hypothetical protein